MAHSPEKPFLLRKIKNQPYSSPFITLSRLHVNGKPSRRLPETRTLQTALLTRRRNDATKSSYLSQSGEWFCLWVRRVRCVVIGRLHLVTYVTDAYLIFSSVG